MPMYEYRCTQCGHVFEELVFGNETPSCPSCHAQAAEKLLSSPCRCRSGESGDGAGGSMPASSGCSGCSGGHCASCGH